MGFGANPVWHTVILHLIFILSPNFHTGWLCPSFDPQSVSEHLRAVAYQNISIYDATLTFSSCGVSAQLVGSSFSSALVSISSQGVSEQQMYSLLLVKKCNYLLDEDKLVAKSGKKQPWKLASCFKLIEFTVSLISVAAGRSIQAFLKQQRFYQLSIRPHCSYMQIYVWVNRRFHKWRNEGSKGGLFSCVFMVKHRNAVYICTSQGVLSNKHPISVYKGNTSALRIKALWFELWLKGSSERQSHLDAFIG